MVFYDFRRQLAGMIRVLLFAICLVIVLKTHSQDHYRVLETEYEYSPGNTYDDDVGVNADVEEFEVNLSLPLPLKNDNALVFGLGYNSINLISGYTDIPQIDVLSDTVYTGDFLFSRYRFTAAFNKKINDEKSLTYMGFFRLASDMVSPSSKDFLYGGLILYSIKKSKKLTMKYGFYANTEHFGWMLIPILGIDWKTGNKTRIYGNLPRSLTLEYKHNKRFRSGLIFEAPNRTYRVTEENAIVAKTGEQLETYVFNFRNTLYLYGEVYLTKSLAFRGRAGYALFRRIEFFEYREEKTFLTWGIEYGAERTPIMSVPEFRSFSDGLILNLSLEYRFNLE